MSRGGVVVSYVGGQDAVVDVGDGVEYKNAGFNRSK